MAEAAMAAAGAAARPAAEARARRLVLIPRREESSRLPQADAEARCEVEVSPQPARYRKWPALANV